MLKRFFDLVLSFFGIILLVPIFIIISGFIYISMGRPIFFKQKRPGFEGKNFKFIKFRTMNLDTNLNGELLQDKERITKLGNWLRKLSLDELPAIWNVLKGDMSLVGPRPLLEEYINLYSKSQYRRHEVKPGITGWAQINGRNNLSWVEKFKLDVWYVDNQSFLLDLKILVKTFWVVFKRENISFYGEATMYKFKGEKEENEK